VHFILQEGGLSRDLRGSHAVVLEELDELLEVSPLASAGRQWLPAGLYAKFDYGHALILLGHDRLLVIATPLLRLFVFQTVCSLFLSLVVHHDLLSAIIKTVGGQAAHFAVNRVVLALRSNIVAVQVGHFSRVVRSVVHQRVLQALPNVNASLLGGLANGLTARKNIFLADTIQTREAFIGPTTHFLAATVGVKLAHAALLG